MEREDQGENAIRIESVYGAFARSFVLPDYVDAKNFHAESKDGVLRMNLWRSRFIELARKADACVLSGAIAPGRGL